MAEERDGRLRWFRPPTRAVIDWHSFTVPRSLAKRWRQQPFRLQWDTHIPEVIAACAERQETWISSDIEKLYVALAERGDVHAVSVIDTSDALVGGLVWSGDQRRFLWRVDVSSGQRCGEISRACLGGDPAASRL